MTQITASQQRSRVRRGFSFMAFFILALIVVCGFTVYLIRNSFNSRREPQAVLDGATVAEFAKLPGDKAFPEAITVGADGNLYVGSYCTGDIWQITPDGTISTWFEGDDDLGAAAGLVFTSNGDLVVADRGDCDPRNGTSSLKRISADGQTVTRIDGVGKDDLPNSLTVDKSDVVYFTDTQNSTVRYITADGTIATWWELPKIEDKTARPTGIVYDAKNDALIVADTESGTVYRVKFDENRQPVTPEEFLYQDTTRELDGLTLDDEGNVIVTLFNVNKVAKLVGNGGIEILAEEFREPSDVAYLNGVVYVVNFDGVSLAPVINFFVNPSLPFTVDAITLPTSTPNP